jgi:hypothetical protein
LPMRRGPSGSRAEWESARAARVGSVADGRGEAGTGGSWVAGAGIGGGGTVASAGESCFSSSATRRSSCWTAGEAKAALCCWRHRRVAEGVRREEPEEVEASESWSGEELSEVGSGKWGGRGASVVEVRGGGGGGLEGGGSTGTAKLSVLVGGGWVGNVPDDGELLKINIFCRSWASLRASCACSDMRSWYPSGARRWG